MAITEYMNFNNSRFFKRSDLDLMLSKNLGQLYKNHLTYILESIIHFLNGLIHCISWTRKTISQQGTFSRYLQDAQRNKTNKFVNTLYYLNGLNFRALKNSMNW